MKRLPKPSLSSTPLMGSNAAPVQNLFSIYVARRELLPILVDRLLVRTGLRFEEAELMLELFGPCKLGWRVPACDSEGCITQKGLEKALMNSQPHVSRRVRQLVQKGLVTTKRVARSGILRKAQKVRLTQNGEELIASIWENYNQLAEKILQDIAPEIRLRHYLVCQRVCARISPGDFLEQSLPKRAPKPAYNVLEIFKTARAVRKPIVEEVLAGTNLSLERADLLVILLLEHPAYAGQAPSQSWSGFVPLATIRNSMVHSISPSKFLLSRWLRDLERLGLVEHRPLDAKRKAARLTTKGVEVTTPILSKYFKLAENLLEDVSPEDRIAHTETNDAVVKAVQPYGRKDSFHRVAAE